MSQQLNMESLCKYNKFGFCKFGNKCRKQHVEKCCDVTNCENKSCVNRHPKMCRYFSIYRRCKFGDFCMFKHAVESSESSLENKINVLEEALEKNKIEIRDMQNKIDRLEQVITNKKYDGNIQIEAETVVENDGDNIDNKCPVCDEVTESSGKLEKHMYLHERIIQLDGDVNISENSKDSINNLNMKLNEYQMKDPNNPHEAPYFKSDEDLDEHVIKCKICGEECDGKYYYNGHVNVFHPCDICLTNSVGIHYCPYRDFIIV